MPPRSKVSTLPAEVRAWLDQALVESNFSGYEALAAALAERGYNISKSALHAYGQSFEERLAALRLASEQARAVVAAAPDDEGAVSEALMRLAQEKLFQLLLASEGKLDISKIGKTVAELVKASVVQKKWSTEVRARAEAAAAQVEKIARKGGLNAETVAEIRREILGVVI